MSLTTALEILAVWLLVGFIVGPIVGRIFRG